MKILILGGDGMLGHQLVKSLSPRHDVRATLRGALDRYKEFDLFTPQNAYPEVDVRSLDRLIEVLAHWKPETVVNAVGIVKQRQAAKELLPSIEINALFPHKLAELCKASGIRMIHMSTDCVFSGKKGQYKEEDLSDAEDVYGKTKFLGEVTDFQCVTLRTSIIGTELSRKQGLLEWFFAQKGTVLGFRKAIFSGFTTLELSRVIEKILIDDKKKSGLYHVSSDPISKSDLLALIKEKMNLEVEISPSDEPRCDRSLDSTRFRKDFGYAPPSWLEMVEELSKKIVR